MQVLLNNQTNNLPVVELALVLSSSWAANKEASVCEASEQLP